MNLSHGLNAVRLTRSPLMRAWCVRPQVALRKLAVVLCVAATLGTTEAIGAQVQPLLRFDAESALQLNPGGAREMTLLNDSGQSYAITAEATLDPPTGQGGARVP